MIAPQLIFRSPICRPQIKAFELCPMRSNPERDSNKSSRVCGSSRARRPGKFHLNRAIPEICSVEDREGVPGRIRHRALVLLYCAQEGEDRLKILILQRS